MRESTPAPVPRAVLGIGVGGAGQCCREERDSAEPHLFSLLVREIVKALSVVVVVGEGLSADHVKRVPQWRVICVEMH